MRLSSHKAQRIDTNDHLPSLGENKICDELLSRTITKGDLAPKICQECSWKQND